MSVSESPRIEGASQVRRSLGSREFKNPPWGFFLVTMVLPVSLLLAIGWLLS